MRAMSSLGRITKLLVGRRLQEELVAALVQHATQRLSGLNRLATNLKIQAIGKKGLELHTRQAALGKQRAVLLNTRNGMRRGVHAANTTASPHRAPHLVPPM